MENSKICFKCKELKPLDNFYKHSQMSDGHLNKCKECTKQDIHKNYKNNSEDPEWINKERTRGRDKYRRLNYRDLEVNKEIKSKSMKNYYDKFPEKKKAKIKSQRIPKQPGNHNHHWSYNEIHYKDVIEISTENHVKIHRFLIYDQERMMYRRTDNNELLDTRQKHVEYADFIILNKED